MPEIKPKYFWLLILLTLAVYIISMFLDLMGPDAVQYAQITREMVETGGFFQVTYLGDDYLDKPPLLFWLNSLVYALTGFTNFFYRLPSFLIALLGLYSTYQLARLLYDRNAARLAVIVLMTSMAWFLLIMDVRTDTLLEGFVIFSIWQLTLYLEKNNIQNLLLGAAGVALAMLSKGPIGLMVPVLALAPDILYRRSWKTLFRWQWLAGLLLVLLLLLPMSIGLYLQYGWEGVRFFFWTQSFGRLTGENVWDNNAGYFFLSHNFLWSFIPWTLLAIYALGIRIAEGIRGLGRKRSGRPEIITLAGFLLPFMALSTSHYQLPHYMYVVFPLIALLTASVFDKMIRNASGAAPVFLHIQTVFTVILWILTLFIFLYLFPCNNILLWVLWALPVLLAGWFRFRKGTMTEKMILPSALSIIAFAFLMMTWFYPILLGYQTGAVLGREVVQRKIPVEKVTFYKISDANFYLYAHSFTKLLVEPDSLKHKVETSGKSWVITDESGIGDLTSGFRPVRIDTFQYFPVTMMTADFLNPAIRQGVLQNWYLVEL